MIDRYINKYMRLQLTVGGMGLLACVAVAWVFAGKLRWMIIIVVTNFSRWQKP